jgi:hypothetical protein
MRSLREAIAGAPAGILAAMLGVLVLGAALFGFAIAELTSGDDGGAIQQTAPAALGGGAQAGEVPTWPSDLTAYTVVIVRSPDRPAALGAARGARRQGLDAGILAASAHGLRRRGDPGRWLVYTGTFAGRGGAQDLAKQLAGSYPGASAEMVQSSQ